MSIKAVLFDLDGTLLKMDQDEFVKTYFKYLAIHLSPRGYEPDKLLKVFWAGVGAMVANDGSCSNEDAFWKVFTAAYGVNSIKDKPYIDEFYKNDLTYSPPFSPTIDPLLNATEILRSKLKND